MLRCSKGHGLQEIGRETIEETLEDVEYRKERIKHFDREGSEFWAEINVPIIVERRVEVEISTFRCATCGETKEVRHTKGPASGG